MSHRKEEFQTPPELCRHMVSLIPAGVKTVLEPTKGQGNLINELRQYDVTAPDDFFKMDHKIFDCVIMNPPFSIEYCYGLPPELSKKGFQVGYHILKSCMGMSDTNSEKRMREIQLWGLKSVCIVPRRWFPGSRASSCILVLEKGYSGAIELTTFDAK